VAVRFSTGHFLQRKPVHNISGGQMNVFQHCWTIEFYFNVLICFLVSALKVQRHSSRFPSANWSLIESGALQYE